MKNTEKWMAYTDSLSSPENYLQWSWRFVISSALQRRVSFGGDPKYSRDSLFPNIYVILTGRAGVGKGVSISPASELLHFHLKKDFITATPDMSAQEQLVCNKIDEANLALAEQATQQSKAGEKSEPLLFPCAPDATTYEKLVEEMGKCFRHIKFPWHDKEGNPKQEIYGHCSSNFVLPELGSLLRKRTDDTVNLLLALYDCPPSYEYKTMTRGTDRILKGCLNILAGTTPEFLETVFDTNLIDQGFSSRAFFIYAPRNRKNVGIREPITPEQEGFRLELLAHIKKLAGLYGQVKVSRETMDWFNKWWDDTETNRHNRSNTSPKLDAYYARKNIHVLKVAMIEHFSESLEMEMPIERIKEAIEILAKEEKNMHMALTFEGDNPIGKLTDKVLGYLQTKKKANMADLIVEFWKDLPNGNKSMEEVTEYLISAGKIKLKTETNETTQKISLWYTINLEP